MKWLRQQGYIVGRAEQRLPIPGLFVTQDMFGFGDILATNGREILLVQVTTNSNLAAREHKARRLDTLRIWLDAGGKFQLHGWAKRGPRGKRKTWQLKVRTL